MDSFTLNTTAADNFGIFELNGPVSCRSELQGLLLHLRQQEQPCSIDTIELYEWTLWSVPNVGNGLIYTQYHCTYHFGIFDGSWATNQLSAASLHLSVLQHRNWRASSSVVDPDDYQVAKLYLEYWWTADSARLHFDLSWFFHHLLAT